MSFKAGEAEETGANHCLPDNPTVGEEFMLDRLADRFRIDERFLLATG